MRQHRPHPKYCREEVCARAQMGYFAQVLKAVPLFLQRVVAVRHRFYVYGVSEDLKGLLGRITRHNFTAYGNGSGNGELS